MRPADYVFKRTKTAAGFPHLLTAVDGAAVIGANQETIGHLETALAIATEYPGTAAPAAVQGVRLKLAGLHFVVGER